MGRAVAHCRRLPRVFYLRYHGYSAYFPAWALGRFARLKRANSRTVQWGM
jgi:squalene-hopene/tetraprenyl-beta-curcumene cyclase